MKARSGAAALVILGLFCMQALAQSYPAKAIRIMVGLRIRLKMTGVSDGS
ncbi:MAG: hypothetical protein IT530_10330 [Burkholderiales bacterium]|nr:hypothetical protein [Burkholderiales bacterium]